MVRVLHCGVRRSMVRSSLARHGIIGARRGKVEQSTLRHGVILALLGFVRSCPARLRDVRHGSIGALRGKPLPGTVLSCPVRLCKVWLSEFLLWYGVEEWGPVRLGQVRLGSAVLGKALLWFGEVLLGLAGWIGALYSMVRSYCGIVWNREARYVIVKFCPVKHCYVIFGKVSLRFCIVRSGTVVSSLARLCSAGQASALFWLGDARWGAVKIGAVMQAKVCLGHGHMR